VVEMLQKFLKDIVFRKTGKYRGKTGQAFVGKRVEWEGLISHCGRETGERTRSSEKRGETNVDGVGKEIPF